jgi:hypothetical protein
VLRQFNLGPLGVGIEQTTNVAETINEPPNPGDMRGDAIRLGGEQPLCDFGKFLLSTVDGLDKGACVSTLGDGCHKPAKLLLDLLSTVAHPRNLARQLRE